MSFSDKPTNSIEIFGFDYSTAGRLSSGETIVSAVVSVAIVAGSETVANALTVVGSAVISGALVTQLISGGQAGTVYLVTCLATTSLNQALPIWSELKVFSAT